MNLTDLTASELFIVEWQYRMLGEFKRNLIEAISRADEINLYKLSLGFPDEVEGYKNYARIDGWWKTIQEKAEIKGE